MSWRNDTRGFLVPTEVSSPKCGPNAAPGLRVQMWQNFLGCEHQEWERWPGVSRWEEEERAGSSGQGPPSHCPSETHPNMAAVCRVFCWGGVEVLVDSSASVPAFSQSKASFSAMPLSFMLFSNTDMINCRAGGGGRTER